MIENPNECSSEIELKYMDQNHPPQHSKTPTEALHKEIQSITQKAFQESDQRVRSNTDRRSSQFLKRASIEMQELKIDHPNTDCADTGFSKQIPKSKVEISVILTENNIYFGDYLFSSF